MAIGNATVYHPAPMNRFHLSLLAALFALFGLFSVKSGAEIVMTGDGAFDSDTIRNADPNQWRWLSFPGSRLTLNPAPGKEYNPAAKWDIPPMGPELPVNIGGFSGKALRLMNVLTVRVSAAKGEAEPSTSRSTVWFPYKITFDAAFPRRGVVSGCDFCVDANGTSIRELRMTGPADTVLNLGGKVSGDSARWEPLKKVLLVTGSNYFYALKVVRLDGADEIASEVPLEPAISAASWSLAVPIHSGSDAFGVSFGFAPASEGKEKAISRAVNAFATPVQATLARSKAAMDGFLRKVPAPRTWGFGEKTTAVSEAQHRRAYYAAWAFLLQNVIDALPENEAYPYPQIAAGKAALWDEGEDTSPATCSWESMFGYQWLSYIYPDLAWKCFEGLMTRVDAQGMLGGESLPSRKAQTGWILFKNKPDRARLAGVYPALKRYLLWREKNPRWVYGTNSARDERDIEFTVSWVVDLDYAVQIAETLDCPADAELWKKKQVSMIDAMRGWFFADPKKIEQFYFENSKTHANKGRSKIIPTMISTALCYRNLPPDLTGRVEQYFRSWFKPEAPLGGFPTGKYPDLNFIAYGLLDRGMPEAKPFLQRFLRDSIVAGEFAEVLEANAKPEGVKPSLFSPLSIIEFTWLLNNVRYESGTPTSFEFKPAPQPARN